LLSHIKTKTKMSDARMAYRVSGFPSYMQTFVM